jgi:hypothetical protein
LPVPIAVTATGVKLLLLYRRVERNLEVGSTWIELESAPFDSLIISILSGLRLQLAVVGRF